MAKSYHFSYGNSTKGPIGFCARIVADTRAEAVENLKEALQDFTGAEDGVMVMDEGEEYIQVYFGIDNLKVSGIDDWEILEEDDDGESR